MLEREMNFDWILMGNPRKFYQTQENVFKIKSWKYLKICKILKESWLNFLSNSFNKIQNQQTKDFIKFENFVVNSFRNEWINAKLKSLHFLRPLIFEIRNSKTSF